MKCGAPGVESRRVELGQFSDGKPSVVQNVVLEPRRGILGSQFALGRAQMPDVPLACIVYRSDAGSAAATEVFEPGLRRLLRGIELEVVGKVAQITEGLVDLLSRAVLRSSSDPVAMTRVVHLAKAEVATLGHPMPMGLASRLELEAR